MPSADAEVNSEGEHNGDLQELRGGAQDRPVLDARRFVPDRRQLLDGHVLVLGKFDVSLLCIQKQRDVPPGRRIAPCVLGLRTSWEEAHEELLHTLGNLTLTGYNAELSNAPFERKKEEFAKSHVEFNRYFAGLERWSAPEIEARSETLIDQALALWPYFGEHQIGVPVQAPNEARVTGTVPTAVRVRESETRVTSWVEVAVVTIEAIASIGDEEFERVTEEMPPFMNRDATLFRRSSRLRKLSNGAYLETNHAASTIYRLCLQAAQLAGLGQDEWEVDHGAASTRDRDASDPGADVSSQGIRSAKPVPDEVGDSG